MRLNLDVPPAGGTASLTIHGNVTKLTIREATGPIGLADS